MSQYAIAAQTLNQALKNKTKDILALIKLISDKRNIERLQIKREYDTLFKVNLIKDIEKELKSSPVRTTLISLFLPPIDFDCNELYISIKGAGTDVDTLFEILTTRPNCILKLIKEQYPKLQKETLEEAVKGDTSGSYWLLLKEILEEKRSDNKKPDLEQCLQIAQELYDAGEKKIGTKDEVFIKVFGSRSAIELNAIDLFYVHLTKHNLKEAIDKEFSSNMKLLLCTMVDSSYSQAKYFAYRLNEVLKEKKPEHVARVIITRKEVDLIRIKEYYNELYGHDVVQDIEAFMKDDMKTLLLELIKS